MRINKPVTSVERRFHEHQKLISTTDDKGTITHCNQAFIDISGFSREELVGSPHNIVRHPDMPQEAFKVMWSYLKAGKPWMGLVKNRCKNGDYYWVNAYVTPVTENGKIIGYESVRICPKREDVARAERIYARINKGKTIFPRRLPAASLHWLFMTIAFIVAAVLGWKDLHFPALAVAMGGSLLSVLFCQWVSSKSLADILKLVPKAFQHPVAIATYTDDRGPTGAIKVAILSELSHLETALTRIQDAAMSVAGEAEAAQGLSQSSHQALGRQQNETELVAAAMHEMTTTINEVSGHVQETARRSDEANQVAQRGREFAATTRQSIAQLNQTVEGIVESVKALENETQKIAKAAEIIEQIAEQTNLLALNAAIEAARAGDQGRGFAVVADEVRGLAKRTQDSTSEIHAILSALSSSVNKSVAIAGEGKHEAAVGLGNVQETEQILHQISETMAVIANMSMQMATAVEEQAQVSDEIGKQVTNIADISSDSLKETGQSSVKMETLCSVAEGMHELVKGFAR